MLKIHVKISVYGDILGYHILDAEIIVYNSAVFWLSRLVLMETFLDFHSAVPRVSDYSDILRIFRLLRSMLLETF